MKISERSHQFEPTGIYGLQVDVILNIVHRFEQCFDRIVNVADCSYKDMKILERVHHFNTIHSEFFITSIGKFDDSIEKSFILKLFFSFLSILILVYSRRFIHRIPLSSF